MNNTTTTTASGLPFDHYNATRVALRLRICHLLKERNASSIFGSEYRHTVRKEIKDCVAALRWFRNNPLVVSA